MKRKFENRLSMMVTVDSLCTKYQSQIEQIPYFMEHLEHYRQILGSINERIVMLESDMLGTTTTKSELRSLMTKMAISLALKVKAYAVHNGKTELSMQMDYRYWELERQADSLIGKTCRLIYNTANAIATDLAEAGVTQEAIDDLKVKITAYESYSEAPRVIRVEHKEWNAEMKNLFKEAGDVLKKMDAMFAPMMIDEPDAYRIYQSARQVIDLKGKQHKKQSMGIEGIITDFETEIPIEGAKVWTAKNTKAVNSGQDGYYSIDLVAGTDLLYIEKPGYVAYKEEIEVEDKVVMENDIELEKVEEAGAVTDDGKA